MRKTILAWVALAGAVPAFAQTVMDFTGDWDLNSSVSGHVTEIITQTKVRHLPVVFAGDRDEAAARVRAKPFMEVGHPVYIMDSCREEDILALARKLKGRYDLKPKLEVTGPACFPAAAVYRKYRDEELFTWVHAVDAPDGFTSEDLTYEPTPMRASRAFARRFVRPASIAKNAAGNWLVDFGRAAFGWVEARTPSAVRAVAGEKLTDQELLNINYTGPWLSDAKKYFSQTNGPAYRLAKDYVKGTPNRQELLETALDWISDGDAAGYMSKHRDDRNASELWNHFASAIEWAKSIFPVYRKEMKGLDWGRLYREYSAGTSSYDPEELEKKYLFLFDKIEKVLLGYHNGGYTEFDGTHWRLTPKGFLISNRIIGDVSDALELSERLVRPINGYIRKD